ncbi:hypothetical protein GOSPT_025_01280 [Gordonia sputi NBRC 100414]|uniref:Uncharacterized protein n=1 Tax=Gordonia sputi NBRC 100414 TaxID=1089453 RepID=H5TX86_9ACTN|nr:hypothetical protein GOSPT_025_01280 [Gordonia sputi NBRC 100414]
MIRMETSWNLSRFDRIEHWVTSQSGLAGSVPVYMSDDLRDSGAMVVDEQVELRRLSDAFSADQVAAARRVTASTID